MEFVSAAHNSRLALLRRNFSNLVAPLETLSASQNVIRRFECFTLRLFSFVIIAVVIHVRGRRCPARLYIHTMWYHACYCFYVSLQIPQPPMYMFSIPHSLFQMLWWPRNCVCFKLALTKLLFWLFAKPALVVSCIAIFVLDYVSYTADSIVPVFWCVEVGLLQLPTFRLVRKSFCLLMQYICAWWVNLF